MADKYGLQTSIRQAKANKAKRRVKVRGRAKDAFGRPIGKDHSNTRATILGGRG